MATAEQRLVTEAKLANYPSIVQNADTGQVAFTLPQGGVVQIGDTGWRDVTALLTGGIVTAGQVLIRREGRRVHVKGVAVTVAPGDAQVLALPNGYRSKGSVEQDQQSYFDGKPVIRLRSNGAAFWINADEAATGRNWEMSWVALDANTIWPAALGTAVTG